MLIPYTRIVFTSFIAYSFGHTLGFAVFTGSAIRFRLYVTAGVSAIEVATVTAFCSLSLGIGLATISGLSLLLSPAHAATALHLHHNWSLLVGAALLCAVAAYACWACFARTRLRDPRLGAAAAGAGDRAHADRALGARPVALERGAVVAAAAEMRTCPSSPSSACTPPP